MKISKLVAVVGMALLAASCSQRKADEAVVGMEPVPEGESGTLAVAPEAGRADWRDASTNRAEPAMEGKRMAEPGGTGAEYHAQAGESRKAAPQAWRDSGRYHAPAYCPPPQWNGGWTGDESYRRPGESGFLGARENPLSTFSVDVDTASYANVRRFLNSGSLPPRDAVRVEEMVNYFDYDYPEPHWGKPFATTVEVARAPWAPGHKLVRIAVKARQAGAEKRMPSNLVFLLDVSGSMKAANKLPLVKKSMLMLLDALDRRDRVAIVTYAGSAGLALESTPADRKGEIRRAIARLEAGGSTAGGQGIQLAYSVARENMVRGGVNRVILCTDGDFNVGVSDDESLKRMIGHEAKSGVFLTVLGFGMGNLKDSKLETLADRGNGVYGYIDGEREAKKHMVDQVQGTLVTVAKDVKIQVEFNPAKVESYRLIGYENRALRNEDFANDAKDAGDIGAGHRVTALYEVVPAGRDGSEDPGDGLRYGRPDGEDSPEFSGELLFVKIRYKEPGGADSRLLTFPVRDTERGFQSASSDFRFAAAVAEFGLILGESEHQGSASLDEVRRIASSSLGRDPNGYRREFLGLVGRAEGMSSWRSSSSWRGED